MDENVRLRILRLLAEAKERVWQVAVQDMDRKFSNRAETIDRKLVDLIEDIRDAKSGD